MGVRGKFLFTVFLLMERSKKGGRKGNARKAGKQFGQTPFLHFLAIDLFLSHFCPLEGEEIGAPCWDKN